MPGCREFLFALGDYLDDAVEPGVRAGFERHLKSCARCRILCETTHQTLRLYRNAAPCALPAEVESRLLAVLESRIRAKL